MKVFFSFLKPAPAIQPLQSDAVEKIYTQQRIKVFLGIFIGYAAYYLVRKNFSLAMPYLVEMGFSKSDLGWASSASALSYGLSKFLMGNLSDRSDAKKFLSLGLLLSALTMLAFGSISYLLSSVYVMFVMMFLSGWFQGMGWPACGRTMVHWFSVKERGTKMSIWNVAHNVGGGLIGPLASLGLVFFAGDWKSLFYFPAIIAIVFSVIIYYLMQDTPQSLGLPPIEQYKNDFPADYSKEKEKELSAKDIFFKYVFNNKYLWYIAIANAFVYLVRYGVIDWAPTYLKEVKGYSVSASNWAYFAYEYAGIPGTLLCGWVSDVVFKGRRAPAGIIYMFLVLIFVLIYWLTPAGFSSVDNIALIAIGFLIYGPVMLIGVHALDLAPKKAAGTAAGLTGLFGYFIGTAIFANIAMGYILDHFGWNGGFIFLTVSCLLSILFIALTWKQGGHKNNK